MAALSSDSRLLETLQEPITQVGVYQEPQQDLGEVHRHHMIPTIFRQATMIVFHPVMIDLPPGVIEVRQTLTLNKPV